MYLHVHGKQNTNEQLKKIQENKSNDKVTTLLA